VGKLVAATEAQRKTLKDATLADLKAAHPALGKGALAVFDLTRAFSARARIVGAPSLRGVQTQLKRWKSILASR
jgi:argininosuccinate lyase